MKYDGMGCVVYLYLTGFWQAGGGANGRRVTRCGWVGAQQVVEGGSYISASAGGITSVLGGCLLFLSLCNSGFQDLLRLKPPISVDVLRMHLYFDGFSDETIHVASFRGEEFSIL